jgi:hypothetical protein
MLRSAPRPVLLLLLGALWGAAPPAASAQDLPPSEVELNKLFRYNSEVFGEFQAFLKGEKTPSEKDLHVLAKAARYYVDRVALLTREKESGSKGLAGIVSEYEGVIQQITQAKAKGEFKQQFVRELIKRFEKVFALDPKVHKAALVNGGRMLEALGQTGQEEAADFLAKLAKDTKQDVIRLYAFKGLREYFEASPPKANPFDTEGLQKEVARLEPLIAFLERKVTLPKGITPEEVAGMQFVRREAIKALAEARLPAVPVEKDKKKTIQAPAAYELLRVLAGGKGALEPAPSLSEKCEAAVGLCRLRMELVKNYKPELAVALVGNFLVDFTNRYRKDRDAIAGASKESRKPYLLPWKYNAARLKLALQEFENNLPEGAPARKQVQELHGIAGKILSQIHQGQQPEEPQKLRSFLRGLGPRAPEPVVYQGEDRYRIDLPGWPLGGGE